MACTSAPSNIPKEMQGQIQSAPSLDVSSLGIQLTKIGSNDSPSLSQDGKKIAFVSQKRPTHAQPQIYFFDLEQLTERRITYQDGECGKPVLIEGGKKVIYSSSTDELKEHPILFRTSPDPSPWPPADLYESDLSGIEIKRLTQRPGFDGLALPRSDTSDKDIIYSQWNGHHLEAWQIHLENQAQKRLLTKKDRSILSLRLSPNSKQWIWIEKTDEGRILLVTAPFSFKTDQQKALTLGKTLTLENFESVEWWDDQNIYFSAQFPKKPFQIYSYNLKDPCLRIQVEHQSNLTTPQLNPTKQGMVFVSDANGGKNIYYKSLSATGSCLP